MELASQNQANSPPEEKAIQETCFLKKKNRTEDKESAVIQVLECWLKLPKGATQKQNPRLWHEVERSWAHFRYILWRNKTWGNQYYKVSGQILSSNIAFSVHFGFLPDTGIGSWVLFLWSKSSKKTKSQKLQAYPKEICFFVFLTMFNLLLWCDRFHLKMLCSQEKCIVRNLSHSGHVDCFTK